MTLQTLRLQSADVSRFTNKGKQKDDPVGGVHCGAKPARGNRKARKSIDYDDPFVRALLSKDVIGRIKEILEE